MINEIHCKVALWLCENHRVILLPTYETSNMMAKKRKGKKLTDKMQPPCKQQKIKANNKEKEEEEDKNAPEETKEHKSLYKKLKQHLKHKLREFPGWQLVLVSKAWTSKTCSGCGWVKHNQGGAKQFICSGGACNRLDVDRDWNGA